MKLESVVPWGRSFDEYRRMFNLQDHELGYSILGCADGPASFNAELTRLGGKVISSDPIYQFSCDEIAERVRAVYPAVMEEVKQHRENFIWDQFDDEEALGHCRMRSMEMFLQDYDAGVADGRYVGASLPFLPFEPQQFRLALCSHFLFLYSDKVDQAEHLKAVGELCRVAEEVRIYPLVDLNAEESIHLAPVMSAMENYGIAARLMPVNYQFQKNATHMLVLKTE